jgi:hypothetical protein
MERGTPVSNACGGGLIPTRDRYTREGPLHHGDPLNPLPLREWDPCQSSKDWPGLV